jgi:apolipoprotein D and lipocalin family protein
MTGGLGQPPLATVDRFDMSRLAGTWHIIANIPYFWERGNVDTRNEYVARDDGRFDETYRYREKSFDAKEDTMNGVTWAANEAGTVWKTRFVWPFTVSYRVLYFRPDYSMIVLGHPSRDYAWVFSRSREMSDPDYAVAMQVLTEHGFDTTRVFKIPQLAEQIGREGFQ